MASKELTKLSVDNAKNTESQTASDSIAAARAALNAGGTRQGATIVAPTKPVTPVVTPASLEPSNAPVVTPTPTPTAAPKLQADLEATQEDALVQKVAAEKTAAEATKGTALQSYLDQLTQAKGLTTLTSEAYAGKGGVDEITPELNDINDQIRREQLSMRRAIEGTQGQGMTKAGSAAAVANIQRESLAKQADLSVIQMAVQGRYDSAKEIADRAVAAQFEQQQQAIDIAKFDYTENKELFTKAEQREYDLLFSDRERKLEEAKQNKQDMYNLGVQASADGAPSSVVQRMFQAKTREEALAIGGGYIGALDRAAKQASINASNASAANSSTDRLIKLAEAGNTDAAARLGITIGGNQPNIDEIAYAQQYASTGKIPTGMPKGISFGSIAALAKDLPKPAGTMVNINTGVKDDSVGTAEKEDLTRLYNITQAANKLAELDKARVGGVLSGTLGKIFGSEDQSAYLAQRKAIVDDIARMQTGAALTTAEQSFYNDYLPGRFSESFFLGQDSEKKIENFSNLMNEKLRNSLANNQLSIYGYSKVGSGDNEVTVGDVVTNAQGQQGIVNADGTVTLIGQ